MKEREKSHSAKHMQDEAAAGGGSSHQNLERMSGRMRTGLGNGAETRNWMDIYQWENCPTYSAPSDRAASAYPRGKRQSLP